MSEADYCILGEGYCLWCRYCIIKYKEDQRLTDDQLFGEVDLEERVSELEGEVKSLNAFLVHKGFAEEYIRWKGDV